MTEGQKNNSEEKKTEDNQMQIADEKITISKSKYDELVNRSKERDEFLNLIQKTKADFVNFQNRISKEMEESRKFLIIDFIKNLLPTLDNFENISKHTNNFRDESVIKGLNLIFQEVFRIFESFGVKPIETKVGDLFDPLYHNVIDYVESSEHKKDAIIEILRKGYTMHDRVIRPTLIKVSKGKPNEGR